MSDKNSLSSTIHVGIDTRYLDDQSQPERKKFVFSYTISVTNNGSEISQLLGRYWHIEDANGQIQEVQGIGVVGEQPRIQPGETYTYSSGAVLETPYGTMRGHYEMQNACGEKFESPIPTFALAQPSSLH